MPVAPASAATEERSDHLPFVGTYSVSRTWSPGHGTPAIDFVMPTGTSVRAAGAGTVVASSYIDCGGQFVSVYHATENRTSHYAHLSSRAVSVGARVARGQVLGSSGNTGSSACTTGPHLHYQEDSGRATLPSGGSGRVDPGVMYACHGSSLSTYTSWAGKGGTTARNDGFSCRSGGSELSGDVFAVHRDDNGRTAVHRLDKDSNFQKFTLQTRTSIGPTTDPARHEHKFADFNGDGVADLYLFDRADRGQIAVHVLDGKSNFQEFLVRSLMPLPANPRYRLDAADYNGDGRAEVYAVDTDDAGMTSVHVLSATSSFKTFLLQTKSVIHETGSDVWAHAVADFDGDRRADLYVFHKNDADRTAVHVIDAASGFRQYTLHTRTALPALQGTDWGLDAGDFDGDGRAEVYAIDPADGGRTAVHVLSPTKNFQEFTLQTKTALPETTHALWATTVAP